MLLGDLERVRLASDPDAIQRSVVDPYLDTRDDSVASMVRERSGADGYLVDGDNPGIGRDGHPRRQTDAARNARLLANRGLRRLRINPYHFSARPLRRAESDTFEMTALGLTSILEYDRDAHDEFDAT